MGITVKDLKFSYGKHPVLKGIDFQLEEGNLVCVLGKNGAGKSTMFRCMLGLLPGYQGEILVEKENVKDLTQRQMAQKMAYIPQTHRAVYSFPVRDMILMGTTASLGNFENPGPHQREMVERAMEQVGITDLADRPVNELSGGEQQLVLIARALAQQTKILIMDEPCSSLDYGNQIRLMQTMKKLAKEGYLVIQSTHNPEHAFLFADQTMALLDGKVAGLGVPGEILTEELLEKMYGIPLELYKVGKENIRVCIPKVF
nr:ABC transporter ATP-binding protein [uncultured Mediterraneibacter sp.]